MLLTYEVRPEGEEVIRLLAQDPDWDEEQDFTLIHKAILGTTHISVEEAIALHPYDLETKDRAERTPLTWAAMRGDEVLVALLLAHGANPNTFSESGRTPLYYACHSPREGAAKCCRLLLEAGAETDPKPPAGTHASPAFMVACGETKDSLAMKTMIEFGADLDATAPDGRTSLHDTAKRDLAERALILLEAGAAINIESRSGQTPLTTAVTYNSHRVLKLLLERWKEFSECPRLKGPNLLDLSATYADIETMKILTDTDHLRLQYDATYSSAEHLTRLQARPDADEKLLNAYRDLLAVVNQKTEQLRATHASALESGHQPRGGFKAQHEDGHYHVPGSWTEEKTEDVDDDQWSDWGDEAFEDALSERLNLDAT